MATIKEQFEIHTSDINKATRLLLEELNDREGQYVWKQLTAEGGDFLSYVVADNENSYPDGAMLDGYWYELYQGGVLIDGEAVSSPLKLVKDVSKLIDLPQLPYRFYNGAAVVLNNEIHILGGEGGAANHYKRVNGEWVEVSSLPYSFYSGAAVVYKGEIHILGGQSVTHHYKWTGTEWAKVSTLPSDVATEGCRAVVYNDCIHLIGGTVSTARHYKWDGTQWNSLTAPSNNPKFGGMCLFNNEIHITGGTVSTTQHYKWTGTAWVKVSTIPTNFDYHGMVVCENELHIIGGYSSNRTYHYKWNGSAWTKLDALPTSVSKFGMVEMDDIMHVIGNGANTQDSYYKAHRAINVPTYRKEVK
jgi:hypothetical protein